MRDMVYEYLQTAEKMAMATVQLFRGKGKALTFEFRLEHSCYDKDGNDIGEGIFFKVRYTMSEGSAFVKVEWTPFSYRGLKEDWRELADHDSCWRNCWDEPLDYGRKKLIDDFKVAGNISWFFNCQNISMEDI